MLPLDYGNPGLCAWQEETLLMWLNYVDGFRCISAPDVPMSFWEQIQKSAARRKPDTIWILVDRKRRETFADYL